MPKIKNILFGRYSDIANLSFAVIFLLYSKRDIKAVGFCDIIFALKTVRRTISLCAA